MVAIVLIQHVQVFSVWAYKSRELTWIVGVVLLLMTLRMASAGRYLRFDPGRPTGPWYRASDRQPSSYCGSCDREADARWTRSSRRDPFAILRLHVFVILEVDRLVCLHVLMVLKLGNQRMANSGRLVKRATYAARYHELTKKLEHHLSLMRSGKDLFFAAFIL